MSERETRGSNRTGVGGLSYRTIGGIVIAALLLLFIVLNRDETEISFVFFERQTALWIALAVGAVGGCLAGFLLGRHRYRT